ncbi:hypothetical protein Tco_0173262 [Tanacetum coccineum]
MDAKRCKSLMSALQMICWFCVMEMWTLSVEDEIQSQILSVMPFEKGKLPMKYLGVPLITKRLESIQVYWCTVFLLPKAALKDINSLLSGFLWCNGELSKGKVKIAWKKICKPKAQGGLDLKDLEV